MTILNILAMGDTHSFGQCGLTPRDFMLSTGSKVELNFVQKYLHDCFDHMVDQLPDVLHAVFLNGDLCEGINPAERGRGICEPDPDTQARGFIKLMMPILRRIPMCGNNLPVFIQRGTSYHAGKGGSTPEAIGQALRAPLDAYGHATTYWRQVKIGNILFDLAHQQTVSRTSKSAGLEKEIGHYFERIGRNHEVAEDKVIFLRSHIHVGYKQYCEQNAMGISLPAWKVQDDFMQSRIDPNRMVPENLGSVLIQVEPETQSVNLVPYLYDHPRIEAKEYYA